MAIQHEIENRSSSRSFSSWLGISCFWILGSLLFTVGCADDEVASRPELVGEIARSEAVAVASDSDLTTVSERNSVQEAAAEPKTNGVLSQAGQILESAKNQGGATASGAGKWVQDKFSSATSAGGQTADETIEWANETFESLKAQGLTTANDTSEWVGQDWQNMESWEYKIISLKGSDEELAAQLNELGKSGWECFNMDTTPTSTRFFLKKPTFSYLRHLPFKDVLKLVPMMNQGGN